jgi:hypothetical protein
MKTQGIIRMSALIAVLLMVNLACYGGTTPTPTPAPVQQPQQPEPQQLEPQQPEPQQEATQTQEPAPAPDSGGLTTFTDQNELYAIDLPDDWSYGQTADKESNNYYIDTFTSPDQLALIENIVYDDGTAFTGSDKSRFSLYLLNTFYSNTGKEGDIRVSEDKIMQDGSERLTWSSKGGGYSGISFLETRGSTTFLFFTVEWVNSASDQYADILNAVIESYRIP